jgi:hypothetical protein
MEIEQKKKVGFNVEPSKWETFKVVARINQSDTNKEIRKFIDEYLKENLDLVQALKNAKTKREEQ